MESGELASVWSGSTDVSNIDTNTEHREGTVSMSFDKSGTTEAFGTISKTLDADHQINIVDYLRGQLRFWINLSTIADVASVTLTIGEDASNNYEYTIADTSLAAGWNEVTFNVDTPSATNGNGAAWSSIGFISVKVTLDGAGDTLTEILVDAISVLTELDINLEDAVKNAAGDGLSISGDVAHDAVDAGEPVKIGYKAVDLDNIPSDVGNLDRVDAIGTLQGDKYTYERFQAAGEDLAADVEKTESRGAARAVITADTQVSAGSGVLRSITIAQGDALPTAGSIIVYDSLTETGTILYSETLVATAFNGYTIHLGLPYGTGLFIGFTTVADVNVTLNHRDD